MNIQVKKIIKNLLGIPEFREEGYLDDIFRLLVKISFIQIGSNDGKNGVPLRNYIIQNECKGILIEPVKYIFDKLKVIYEKQKDNLVFIN
mgnify:CR=1 FL=1